MREQAKLMVKVRGVFTYEGIKPPKGYGLFTRKGAEWLRGLGLDSVDSYLRVISTLK